MNIPKLRFGEFSEPLTKHNLGEIAEFSKGKGISKSDIEESGEVECVRYGELYTTYNEVIDSVESRTNLPIESLVLSEANDIIIPASGETQLDIATASCVLRDGIALSGDLNIIKTDQNGVFTAFYLNSKKKFDIAAMAQGNSVVHLYAKQLRTLNLNLPTLPEQTKIANFLSAVNAKIANLSEEKSLLENYKKGVMQKIFSRELRFKRDDGSDFPEWETKTFADVAKFINGKAYRQAELFSSGKYKVLRVGNLFSNNEWYYSDLELDEDKYVEDGDLMYAWSASFGPQFWKGAKTIYHYHIWKVIPDETINKLFLYFVFIDDIERIKSQSQGGTMFHITKGSIESRKLKVPTLPEQTKIANFLTSIDEKINTATDAIEKAQEWKKGLLQQLFV